MPMILIAEDDSPSRELLAEILLEWGYDVEQASSGVEALAAIERMCPDLLLLDIQMPLLDGFAVLATIRADPRLAELPVVAISAYAMRDDTRRIREAGFDAQVPKPIKLEALRSLLRQIFNAETRSGVNVTTPRGGTGSSK